jgi:hypothetical protein
VTASGKVSAKEMLRFARKPMLTQMEVGYPSLGTFSRNVPRNHARIAQRATLAIHRQVRVDDTVAGVVRAGPGGVGAEQVGLTPFAFANAVRIGSSSPV